MTVRAAHRAGRVACGIAALLTAGAATAGLRDPLSSMTDYTAALMTLNQLVPPLILLSLPPRLRRHIANPSGRGADVAHWLFDPAVAMGVFVSVTVAVSLPGIFDPAVANALFSAPLGLLELLCGVLVWSQLFRNMRRLYHDWQAGIFGVVAGVPMTVVAVVWMLSPAVLYTPYLDVICRWNVSPLQDQRLAGFVMLLAGLPLQLASVWLILRLASTAITRETVRS